MMILAALFLRSSAVILGNSKDFTHYVEEGDGAKK
jgi:hypothetical protein